jgi:hypothetical protein
MNTVVSGAGGQTCICEAFVFGIQHLMAVFVTLSMKVSAVTKCAADGCRNNCPIQGMRGKVRNGSKDIVLRVQIIQLTRLLVVNIALEKLTCCRM